MTEESLDFLKMFDEGFSKNDGLSILPYPFPLHWFVSFRLSLFLPIQSRDFHISLQYLTLACHKISLLFKLYER